MAEVSRRAYVFPLTKCGLQAHMYAERCEARWDSAVQAAIPCVCESRNPIIIDLGH
jgi:hypothetical protein